MKIKRVLTLVLIFIMAFALVGCGSQNTETALANNLDKSTTKLSSLISSLEGVEYDDIIIDNISPLESVAYKYGTAQTAHRQNNVLQKTKSYEINGLSSKNTSNGVLKANSPKQNSSVKYVSNNGEKIDVNKSYSNNDALLNKTKNSNRSYNIGYNSNNNSYCENDNCYSNQNVNIQNSKYSYLNDYKPKYVNEVSESFSRNQLDSYLQSIEEVYNLCADCVCCDAEYKNEISKLQLNIKDCKTYCSKLRDGTINLSEEEIKECYDCLDCLTSCVSRLKSTKGNIDSKTTEILKDKDNFGSKLSSLREEYKSLYNALEGRLQYVKQCNENINCIFDILSKANVDIKQAEKNKSDESDIIKEQEKLEKEQNALQEQTNNESSFNKSTNLNLDNIKNNNNNITNNKTNITNNYSDNNIEPKNNTDNKKNNDKIIDKNSTHNNDEKLQNQNTNNQDNNSNFNENSNNQNNNSNTKTEQNTDTNKDTHIEQERNNDIENINKTSEQNDVNNKNTNGLQQSVNKPQNNKQIVTKRTQKTVKNQNDNSSNTTKQNVNNQNVNYPVNNGVNYGYGYGYPNGYNGPVMPYGNNVPYPPRNIDTYKTIVKNTDTYRPNYVPNSTNNNQNTVEETTTTYEVENMPETETTLRAENNTNNSNNANNQNNVNGTNRTDEVIKAVYDVKN